MKIDLDWIQKELDAGREVKLEGINGGYINKDNYVLSIDGDGLVVSIGTGKMWLSPDSFKHFCIKRSTPTFKDLVNVAVQAIEDKLIFINLLTDWQLQFVRGDDTRYIVSHDSRGIKREIDFINSLYTETFVIESVEDMRKMKKEAKGLLPNGLEFTVTYEASEMFSCKNSTAITVNFSGMEYNELLYLSPLKGATVTQQKGNK